MNTYPPDEQRLQTVSSSPSLSPSLSLHTCVYTHTHVHVYSRTHPPTQRTHMHTYITYIHIQRLYDGEGLQTRHTHTHTHTHTRAYTYKARTHRNTYPVIVGRGSRYNTHIHTYTHILTRLAHKHTHTEALAGRRPGQHHSPRHAIGTFTFNTHQIFTVHAFCDRTGMYPTLYSRTCCGILSCSL